jgi:signal transduction histidine kinase
MLKDKRLSYALRMTLIIFSCLVASTLFFLLTTTVIRMFGIKIFSVNSTIYLLISLGISFVIAYIIAIIVSKKTGKDYEALKRALNEVANGNFDVVIPEIKSRRYLSPIIKDFNVTVKQLKGLEIMRSEFITNFSHELKTPIAIIQGYAEGLKLGIKTNSQSSDEYCDIIIEETHKMNRLVCEMLELSKFESGAYPLSPREFDIRKFIID